MRRTTLRILTGMTILISTICFQPPAEALFTGVKGMGMANAVAAHPLDTMVARYNPAGLSFVGNRWDLGVHWVKNIGKSIYSGNANVGGSFDSHHTWDNLFIPEFGVNQDTCNCLFTWGFVFYNCDFTKTTFNDPNAIFGTKKPGLEYLHYVAGPTGTVRFGTDHALGITLDIHGHRIKADGLENFANDTYSKHRHRVTDEGYGYSVGGGFTVGWFSKVSHCVSLGLSWSPKVEMQRINDYKGLIAKRGKLDIPQRFIGGIAIEMLDNFTIAFDVEHLGYNGVSALTHDFMSNIEHKRLGSDEGPGLGWRDQTVFRLGLDWVLDHGYALRLGYWHSRTPVKGSQTLVNTLVPNIVEHWLTWGGSYQCGLCNEFSFYGGYGFRNTVHGKDSISASFGGGEVDLREEKWMAGFTWGRRY